MTTIEKGDHRITSDHPDSRYAYALHTGLGLWWSQQSSAKDAISFSGGAFFCPGFCSRVSLWRDTLRFVVTLPRAVWGCFPDMREKRPVLFPRMFFYLLEWAGGNVHISLRPRGGCGVQMHS